MERVAVRPDNDWRTDEKPVSGRVKPAANYANARASLILVDPHPLNRQGLSKLLSDRFTGIVVSNCAEFPKIASAYDEDWSTAVVVVVLRPGLAALSYFLEALPFTKRGAERARIVVVSEEWTPAAVKQALAHGVSGCISSANGFDVLAAALNLVLLGERFVPADAFDGAHERVAAPLRSDCCGPVIAGAAFTPQERRVLAALLEGKSNKKIARDLELCESTVKVHVRHIMRKLSVNNRTQVALCLMRRSGDAVERQSAPA